MRACSTGWVETAELVWLLEENKGLWFHSSEAINTNTTKYGLLLCNNQSGGESSEIQGAKEFCG